MTAVRQAIKLPAARRRGAADPRRRRARHRRDSRRVVTPNDSFYRIDTALHRAADRPGRLEPADPRAWSRTRSTLTWDELLALPLEESVTTLTCVSNEVGGDLIGNALWLGYPIRELLARAKPTADADMVLSRSIDGFTASTPLEVLQDDRNAILAVGMNGEPLPPEHGFPVRMVVPGLYGYVSATKWVIELEVTRFDQAHGVLDRPRLVRARADQARVAHRRAPQGSGTQGRRDRDRGRRLAAAGRRRRASRCRSTRASGCRRRSRRAISDDTWVQWSYPWTAKTGDHVIRCRATSKTGELQTEDEANPAPDGATGWHWRTVSVFD